MVLFGPFVGRGASASGHPLSTPTLAWSASMMATLGDETPSAHASCLAMREAVGSLFSQVMAAVRRR